MVRLIGKLFGREITSNYELISRLKKLNPMVDFEYDGTYSWIRPSVVAEELQLPKPFYYNAKNGITNKHQTKTGQYICLAVL